jgi:Putative zinc-finger
LDCREYKDDYVAAHADGELSPLEVRLVDEHVAKCASCRALLSEECSLKALIRKSAGIIRTPADVRLRISAALGDLAEPKADRDSNLSRIGWLRDGSVDRDGLGPRSTHRRNDSTRPVARLTRGRLLTSVGGAVAMVIAIAIFAGHITSPSGTPSIDTVPAFDLAINKYLSLQRNFRPNVPPEAYSNAEGVDYAWVQDRDPVQRVATAATDAADDVSRAYREMSMPDDLLDLSPAGYRLAGGRADRLPDGRPVTYTLYASDSGTILSICYPDAAMAAPVGAINWFGMRSFYRYKGYSICMSFYPAGHFVSILVSRMPVTQLLNDVVVADSTTTK